MIEIQAIPAFNDNYIWIIVNNKSKACVVVDPGEASHVLQFIDTNNLTLEALLITHHHWDHINGIKELLTAYPKAQCYGPTNVGEVQRPLSGGMFFTLPQTDIALDVLAVPGHTLSHLAFIMQDHLFCGDTLFSAGCGRLFEGTPQQMYLSLQKLRDLPETTKVYAGHEYTLTNLQFAATIEPQNQDIQNYTAKVQELTEKGLPTLPSTLALEKKINPFLRCDLPEIMDNMQTETPLDTFTTLRSQKDKF